MAQQEAFIKNARKGAEVTFDIGRIMIALFSGLIPATAAITVAGLAGIEGVNLFQGDGNFLLDGNFNSAKDLDTGNMIAGFVSVLLAAPPAAELIQEPITRSVGKVIGPKRFYE